MEKIKDAVRFFVRQKKNFNTHSSMVFRNTSSIKKKKNRKKKA